MAEITNCGVYFQNVPASKYETIPGVGYIKTLLYNFSQVLMDTPLNIAAEVTSYMIRTDDIFINSAMTIFSNMYVLRGNDEVQELLRNNTFLVPIVAEAYGKLQTHFPYSTIYMDVIEDELVISVGTTLSPEQAKNALYRFDEEWWLDVCINSQSKLCITVEFQ